MELNQGTPWSSPSCDKHFSCECVSSRLNPCWKPMRAAGKHLSACQRNSKTCFPNTAHLHACYTLSTLLRAILVRCPWGSLAKETRYKVNMPNWEWMEGNASLDACYYITLHICVGVVPTCEWGAFANALPAWDRWLHSIYWVPPCAIHVWHMISVKKSRKKENRKKPYNVDDQGRLGLETQSGKFVSYLLE